MERALLRDEEFAWPSRLRRMFHTYVWNRRAFGALVVASPAILTSLSSLAVGLTSTGATDPMKYALDKLYRLNAAGSLRRIAAAVYPDSWKSHTADYDALVASDYGDPATVQKLTDAENRLVQDALSRITIRQVESNRMSERIERLESRKSKLQTVLNGLMYVLTVVVFFIKTAD